MALKDTTTALSEGIDKANDGDIRQAAERIVEQSRRDLLDFTCWMQPNYIRADHLILLSEKLMAVERGEIKKLMVFMPPRHGKSELTSVKFPAWALGKDPSRRIIHCSYSAALSNSFSRKIRNLMEETKYRAVFDVRIHPESRSVTQWDLLKQKGGLISSGVGGAITGYGGDIIIIDDPVKNRAEAESRVYQERNIDWFKSVVRTRLEPNASMIVIMTRWHQKDLAGQLLAEQSDWEVINLEAMAEPNDILGREQGEPLWADRYGIGELTKIKKEIGSRAWAALYQGNPLDPESQLIKEEWFSNLWYDMIPHRLDVCTRGGGVDTATELKTSADNTSLVDVIKDPDRFIYVDDVFCDKITVSGFAKLLISRHTNNRYSNVYVEKNNAGEAFRQRIVEIAREKESSLKVSAVATTTDKVLRVHDIAPLIENGTLKFKRGNKRVAELVRHLIDTPQPAIWDDVDALGFAIKAVKGLDHMPNKPTDRKAARDTPIITGSDFDSGNW